MAVGVALADAIAFTEIRFPVEVFAFRATKSSWSLETDSAAPESDQGKIRVTVLRTLLGTQPAGW